METWALMVEISRLGLEMEEILMKLEGIGDVRRPVKKVERRSTVFHCKMYGICISSIYKTMVQNSIEEPTLKILSLILVNVMANGDTTTTSGTSGDRHSLFNCS